jgi:uncharacterized membrane protein
MKKQPKTYIFYAGIGILAAGLALKLALAGASGPMESLPYVLMGFGSGIVVVGAVGIFRARRLKNDPERARQLEIDENDERNIRLREKSGYATWRVTLLALAAMALALKVLGDDLACYLSMGALLVHVAVFFVCERFYGRKI